MYIYTHMYIYTYIYLCDDDYEVSLIIDAVMACHVMSHCVVVTTVPQGVNV